MTSLNAEWLGDFTFEPNLPNTFSLKISCEDETDSVDSAESSASPLSIGRGFGRVNNPPEALQNIRLVMRYGLEVPEADLDGEVVVNPNEPIRRWLETAYSSGRIPKGSTIMVKPRNNNVEDLAILGNDIPLLARWTEFPDYFVPGEVTQLIVMVPNTASDTSFYFNATEGNVDIYGARDDEESSNFRYADDIQTGDSTGRMQMIGSIIVEVPGREGAGPRRYVIDQRLYDAIFRQRTRDSSPVRVWPWGGAITDSDLTALRNRRKDANGIYFVTLHPLTLDQRLRRAFNSINFETWNPGYGGRAEAMNVLRAGANPSLKYNDAGADVSPLRVAIMTGDVEMLRFLIEKHVSLTTAYDMLAEALQFISSERALEVDGVLRAADARWSQERFEYHIPGNPARALDMDVIARIVQLNQERRAERMRQALAPVRQAVSGHASELQMESQLIEAAMRGEVDRVDELIRAGVDVNAGNTILLPPLMFASQNGFQNIVNRLLAAGANVNYADDSGMTPLMLASRREWDQVVKSLLRGGADVSARNANGQTALQLTTNWRIRGVLQNWIDRSEAEREEGRREFRAELERRYGARPGQAQPAAAPRRPDAEVDESTPEMEASLMDAANSGDLRQVQDLVMRGVNVNALPSGEHEYTALMEASHGGHFSVVDYLLHHGADVHIPTSSGRTALLLAAREGYGHIVRNLLLAGADVMTMDDDENTAMDLAANEIVRGTLTEWMELGEEERQELRQSYRAEGDLLRGEMRVPEIPGQPQLAAAAPVSRSTPELENQLFVAVNNNNEREVRRLIQAGVNVNTQNVHGFTPLIMASNTASVEILDILLEAGGDITIASHGGWRPIHFAADRGRVDILQRLVEAGASIESRTPASLNTPLMLASRSDQSRAIDFLIQKGANIEAVDEIGYTALMLASVEGNYFAVLHLLKAGASVRATNSQLRTALMLAALKGRHHLIELLLQAGSDISARDRDGRTAIDLAVNNLTRTPLETWFAMPEAQREIRRQAWRSAAGIPDVQRPPQQQQQQQLPSQQDQQAQASTLEKQLRAAVRTMNPDEVRRLIRAGANVNGSNHNRKTALMLAAASGQVQVMSDLIHAGADVNARDNAGATALFYAIKIGFLQGVDLLIRSGADVNVTRRRGRTALMLAAGKGHVAIVNSLLQAGADVNTRDEFGHNAIFNAVASRSLEIVELLLIHGANVNFLNNENKSVLMLAAQTGNAAIVERLLHAGANVYHALPDGRTALSNARSDGARNLLEQWIAMPEEEREEHRREWRDEVYRRNVGRNPPPFVPVPTPQMEVEVNPPGDYEYELYLASEGGRMDEVERLIEMGVNVNTDEERGYTPLTAAVRHEHANIVGTLLAAGADINQTDIEGIPPLIIALNNRDAELASMLINARADVNATDRRGVTPLMVAAEKGFVNIITLLLAAGANIDAQDNVDHATALVHAIESRKSEAVERLLAAGANVNMGTDDTWIPLSHAINREVPDVLLQLLLAGASYVQEFDMILSENTDWIDDEVLNVMRTWKNLNERERDRRQEAWRGQMMVKYGGNQ